MILTNALCALSQALDLRWLEVIVRSKITNLVDRSGIKLPTFTPPGSTVNAGGDLWGFIPWYDAAYCPQRVAGLILDARLEPINHINRNEFVAEVVTEMEQLMADVSSGKFIGEVAATAGTGNKNSHHAATYKLFHTPIFCIVLSPRSLVSNNSIVAESLLPIRCSVVLVEGLCTASEAAEVNQFSSVQSRRSLCIGRLTVLHVYIVATLGLICRSSHLVAATCTLCDATKLRRLSVVLDFQEPSWICNF